MLEVVSWAIRVAFFLHGKDISSTATLLDIISQQDINIAILNSHIESGRAFSVLSEDMKMAMDMTVKSSPTLIFNEDRQRLTGNVGYKIIQANIRELLNSPNKQHSWC